MVSDTKTQPNATVYKPSGSCEDIEDESLATVELVGSRLSRPLHQVKQNLPTQKENVQGESDYVR